MKFRIEPCEVMTADAHKIDGYRAVCRDENSIISEGEVAADYKKPTEIEIWTPEAGDYVVEISATSTRPGAFPSLPWVYTFKDGKVDSTPPGSRHNLQPVILPAPSTVKPIEGDSTDVADLPVPEEVVKKKRGRPRKIEQTH